MTVPSETATLDPCGKLPENRPHMIRRRFLTALTIVLLVGIPAGYLVISAGQSRDSGRDKERESSAGGLQDNWPSQMKRRIFEVPIPGRATDVAYYETSNWKTSRLYVQFTTSADRLDAFLEDVGTSRSRLEPGSVTVSDRDAGIVGWRFPSDRDWSALSLGRDKPRPGHDITVDLTDPAAPRVYVVSTTTP
ncbi:hypothetical protein [Streptomyces sp. NBC_01216]|uniref:hypothetical protein n=1 Tax=unclassified Streptomyces TaxID=2593676 RepID=UPI002E149964|nr:hypothetical protein OG393_05130 [Streptomyces sp. NBC_01216]